AGGDRRELLVVCRAIKASDALVLAEVEGQNGVGGDGRGCRRHRASSVGRWWWKCGNSHVTTPHGLHGFFRRPKEVTNETLVLRTGCRAGSGRGPSGRHGAGG